MKYKNLIVLSLAWFLSGLSSAEVGARLSIVKGGDKPSWISLSNHLQSNPIKLFITDYGDWTHCEAYSKPHLASAFVRCFTYPNRNGASVGAYCDLDNKEAWKPRQERNSKSEFHLDAGKFARGWVTVTLDCGGD